MTPMELEYSYGGYASDTAHMNQNACKKVPNACHVLFGRNYI